MWRICVSAICVAALLAMGLPMHAVHAAAPATTQAGDDSQELDDWWADLAKPEPWCSRALLDFSSKPDQAVAYFKEHLKPLKLEQKDLDDAMKDLASDDETVWKPAFEKLSYFDPRLVVDLDTLMQNTQEPAAKTRLASILNDADSDTMAGQSITIQKYNNGQYIIRAGSGGAIRRAWIVDGRVSHITKAKWTRASRAIVLLQHIGTPGALAILKDLATGDPQAQPTKIAKVAVDSLSSPER